MSDRTWTVAEVLRWTTEDLSGRGFDSPRLDAEVLLAHVLRVDRIHLYMSLEKPLLPEERLLFRGVVERRRTGEPVAYITQRKDFYGRPYFVDRRVLIPRPETELLAEAAIARFKEREAPARGIDVGTGSGAIAVTLARECPSLTVDAVDLSRDALDVAQKNARDLGVWDRVRFVQGNLLEPFRANGRFDLVIANLPYITTDELPALDRTVKDFEPHAALDGGPDGLTLVGSLVRSAPAILARKGWLLLEVGLGQATPVAEEIRSTGAFEPAEVMLDLSRVPRFVLAQRAT